MGHRASFTHARRVSVFLIAALAACLLLTGCMGSYMEKRTIGQKLKADHPGFGVGSLTRLQWGHGDGVGDRWSYVIESRDVPGFKIAGTMRIEGEPDYLDADLISQDPGSPYKLTDRAKQRFMRRFVADFPGRVYYPNQSITQVTATPPQIRDDLIAGVEGKGDPADFFLIGYAPKDRANRVLSDVAVSALYYRDPQTDNWRLIERSGSTALASGRSGEARKRVGFATAEELMDAIIDAIHQDPTQIAQYYDPRRVLKTDSRTAFPPEEEIRRAMLDALRFSELTPLTYKREAPAQGASGADLVYQGRIMRDGKAVRTVDITLFNKLYYVDRIDRTNLTPR
jgi:hypothetical protein